MATVAINPCDVGEFRENGRLLGVVSAWESDAVLYLQHIVVWPGAPAGTLLQMVRAFEREAWSRYPNIWGIVVDVEHDHPQREALLKLKNRLGYTEYHADEKTTWSVKRRPA